MSPTTPLPAQIRSAWMVARREMGRLARDPNLFLILFVAPLVYTALYGSVYLKKIEESVPVDIVDMDRSPLSRDLIREIGGLQSVRVREAGGEESRAREALVSSRIQAWVTIPEGFSEDIYYGRAVTLPLVVSPGRLLVLSDVGVGISTAASTFGARIRAGVLAREGVPVFQDPAYAVPVSFSYTPLFNPWLTYGDMILPGLMALIFLQLTFIGSAAGAASEWVTGGWPHLFAISGEATWPAVAGKLLMFTGVFTFSAFLLSITVIPIMQIRIGGDPLILLTSLLLAFWAMAGMGLWVGSYLRYRTTAFVVLGFTSYPFFFLSGYAWPSTQIDLPVRIFSRILPTTPFLHGMNLLTQMENGWDVLWPHLLNLGTLALLFSLLAVRRLRRIRQEEASVSPSEWSSRDLPGPPERPGAPRRPRPRPA